MEGPDVRRGAVRNRIGAAGLDIGVGEVHGCMGSDAEERDRATVDALVRGSGTSFYWAIRLLPQEKRRAMFAVYAFCREVDDIADGPDETAVKRARLEEWRREVERLFAGAPSSPISRALAGPVRRYRLRREDFDAIIAGMEMDARDRLRIADRTELALYCDRVACAVGRLSARIFGADSATADALAAALGEALQLTNILRDLSEDAARDRLYLPADMLHGEGIDDADDATAVLRHPRTAVVCQRLAEMAARDFREAEAVLARCDHRQMRPAIVMMEVYRRTLSRLVARGWRRWSEPVSVPRWEKLWVALRYGTV